MNIFLIYLLFCTIMVLPFFVILGLFLLFLNKSKTGKQYAKFIIRKKFILLSIDNKKISKEQINWVFLVMIKIYNFTFLFFLTVVLLFLIFGGIAILFKGVLIR